METVNICDAKAQLSKLIQQAADGKDVIIGRNGKPVARLTQLAANKRVMTFGLLKGKMLIADDWRFRASVATTWQPRDIRAVTYPVGRRGLYLSGVTLGNFDQIRIRKARRRA